VPTFRSNLHFSARLTWGWKRILISSFFCWDVKQRRLVVNYQHFGIIYPPGLQGSNPGINVWPFDTWIWDRSSRNVGKQQCTLCNFQEERISHLHREGSLKSHHRQVLPRRSNVPTEKHTATFQKTNLIPSVWEPKMS